MAYEAARVLLEKATTPLEREAAVRAAMQMGMPLHEIEQFLDWLDLRRRGNQSDNGHVEHE